MRSDPVAQDFIQLDLENVQNTLSAQCLGQLVLLFDFVSGKKLALIYIQFFVSAYACYPLYSCLALLTPDRPWLSLSLT